MSTDEKSSNSGTERLFLVTVQYAVKTHDPLESDRSGNAVGFYPASNELQAAQQAISEVAAGLTLGPAGTQILTVTASVEISKEDFAEIITHAEYARPQAEIDAEEAEAENK